MTISETGLLKFSVPISTLDAARSDLADLRILDPDGIEIPYAIELPQPIDQRNAKAFQVSLENQKTSLFVETGTANSVNALEFQTYTKFFIKSVIVEGTEDSGNWKILAKGQPIFREIDGSSQVRVPIPSGRWKFFRVSIDDSRSAPISIYGIQLWMIPQQIRTEEMPVKLLNRIESASQTRLALDLGGSNLTLSAIEIETPEIVFKRKIKLVIQQVSANEITEQTIATGVIERSNSNEQSKFVRFSLPEDLKIPSRNILLFIENQQSPPIMIHAMKVQRRQVFAMFVSKKVGQYSILTGNNQGITPTYDLKEIQDAFSKAKLIAPDITSLERNPEYSQPKAFPEIVSVGAALDVADWKYKKAVGIEKAGIQELELDLEVLSHAKSSLQDLRLIHEGRQIPYLLERTSISKEIPVKGIEIKDPNEPSITKWKLVLPFRSLPIVALQCKSQTAVFQRRVAAYEFIQDERGSDIKVNLGSADWKQTLQQKQGELMIPFTSPQTDTVYLEINHGDNPAIQIGDFKFLYYVTRVIFKTENGIKPNLYYGNGKANTPAYDIRLIAPQFIASERSHANLKSQHVLQKPSLSEKYMGTRTSNLIFWIVLIGVTSVLIVIVTKLLPKKFTDANHIL